jgi:hypothetical protein
MVTALDMIWEKPVISRLVSLDHHEIKRDGLLRRNILALFGRVGAPYRRRNVVTKGHEIVQIVNDLMVAGHHYYAATGPLPTARSTTPHPMGTLDMVRAVTQSAVRDCKSGVTRNS